jgi:hypothetical protein
VHRTGPHASEPSRASSELLRLAVDDPAPARPHVDAAVDAGVAGDDGAEAVLVLVVVDADPGGAGVVRAEKADHVADLADEVEGRVRLAGGGLAEAEAVGLCDTGDRLVRLAGVGRVIEFFEVGQPDVAFDAGRRRRRGGAVLVVGERGQALRRGGEVSPPSTRVKAWPPLASRT